jgi:hypothetical protein
MNMGNEFKYDVFLSHSPGVKALVRPRKPLFCIYPSPLLKRLPGAIPLHQHSSTRPQAGATKGPMERAFLFGSGRRAFGESPT